MNFFEHQAQARRNSALLITLFAVAVAGLIAITTLFSAALVSYSRGEAFSAATVGQVLGWDTVIGIALFVAAVIVLASLYKLRQLADGGRAVAESLGGRKINVAPKDTAEQRALNVVEEMAIASGTPVPDVYILEDPAINAFAAGYKPSDAVIGLTRGCIEQLTREQLQGVVAHEFSHIFNGDMRLNIRIVGLLHGILIIGLAGYWLLRGSHWSGGRDNRGRVALAGIGAGLIAIGYTGTFFGNLVKSAVSRQREYLADASAVQYTRSNGGIAGALKKIGGYPAGSRIAAANAAEFSHMYFASGLKKSFTSLFSTHPPLHRRIQRLDPQWQGASGRSDASGMAVGTQQNHQVMGMAAAGDIADQQSSTVPGSTIADAIDNSIGNPNGQQYARGKALLARIPETLQNAAREPFSARALVYALLMHPDQRCTQTQLLEQIAHPAVIRAMSQLLPAVQSLPASCRLPLLDLCVPALKDLAPQQYQIFKRNLIKLLRSDGRVEIWEWALYRVLMHALEGTPDRQRQSSHKHAAQDASRYLLAAMSHAGNAEYLPAKRAYEQGLRELGLEATPLPARNDILLQRLDKAVAIATGIPPLRKPGLLKAMATTLAHDGEVTAREVELLRAVADSLDCPMPPLLSPASTAVTNGSGATAAAL